jgi:hypothetical protein
VRKRFASAYSGKGMSVTTAAKGGFVYIGIGTIVLILILILLIAFVF